MAVALDLADIQGNILSAYGKQGFPKGRFITLHVDDPALGRKFINTLLPQITTALRWPSSRSPVKPGVVVAKRPLVAINIAFSWLGLLALRIPTRTLRGMPDEFIDGMMARAPMLGDDFFPGWLDKWDKVWRAPATGRTFDPNAVHILITLNAQANPDGTPVPELAAQTEAIEQLCRDNKGVRVLPGHSRGDLPGQPSDRYQDLTAIMVPGENGARFPSPKEHFGYTDALGDPVFDGQYPGHFEKVAATGNGAFAWKAGTNGKDGEAVWRPLATGEFLLGYPDEAQEIAGAAMPLDFSCNGTFMAYRKLSQNVDAFESFINETAVRFGAVFGINNPQDAKATLIAKIAGRWADGVPLALAPNADEWRKFNIKYPEVSPDKDLPGYLKRSRALIDFTYNDDPDGLRCPMTSHLRRINTRDALAPTGTEGSVLNNRRRILRRGLPYGGPSPEVPDSAERGIIMLVVCANLFRQFEFVQQQWINYGLDSNSGNDTCPLVGNHSAGGATAAKAKFVIASDPKSGRPPFVVEGIPQFVDTRGGEYFFVPSMTSLRMIGMGTIDPT
jgi:deferrochelatase/peroxidase EfeB